MTQLTHLSQLLALKEGTPHHFIFEFTSEEVLAMMDMILQVGNDANPAFEKEISSVFDKLDRVHISK